MIIVGVVLGLIFVLGSSLIVFCVFHAQKKSKKNHENDQNSFNSDGIENGIALQSVGGSPVSNLIIIQSGYNHQIPPSIDYAAETTTVSNPILVHQIHTPTPGTQTEAFAFENNAEQHHNHKDRI